MSNTNSFEATFGGEGWSPRTQSLQQELGTHWRACGINSEWAPLKTVLLHSPGDELAVLDLRQHPLKRVLCVTKPDFIGRCLVAGRIHRPAKVVSKITLVVRLLY